MLKIRTILKLLFISLIGITFFGHTFAKGDQNLAELQEKIKKIDFSKEPSEEEKALIIEYHKVSSMQAINNNLASYIARRDKIDFEKDILSSDLLFLAKLKAYSPNNFVIENFKSASTLGTVGDVLITYSFSSFKKNMDASKHAAIVHENANYTIESYPENEIRVYSNDWANKSRVYGIRVKDASINDYKNVARDALRQDGENKSYSTNLFNKEISNSFYSLELVLKTWKNQGFDIDFNNLESFKAVSRVELTNRSNTYVFYEKE